MIAGRKMCPAKPHDLEKPQSLLTSPTDLSWARPCMVAQTPTQIPAKRYDTSTELSITSTMLHKLEARQVKRFRAAHWQPTGACL